MDGPSVQQDYRDVQTLLGEEEKNVDEDEPHLCGPQVNCKEGVYR